MMIKSSYNGPFTTMFRMLNAVDGGWSGLTIMSDEWTKVIRAYLLGDPFHMQCIFFFSASWQNENDRGNYS